MSIENESKTRKVFLVWTEPGEYNAKVTGVYATKQAAEAASSRHDEIVEVPFYER